jgi:hypothetical protein
MSIFHNVVLRQALITGAVLGIPIVWAGWSVIAGGIIFTLGFACVFVGFFLLKYLCMKWDCTRSKYYSISAIIGGLLGILSLCGFLGVVGMPPLYQLMLIGATIGALAGVVNSFIWRTERVLLLGHER